MHSDVPPVYFPGAAAGWVCESCSHILRLPGGPAVTCVSGGIAAAGLQFSHGYELYFENATLLFDAGTVGGEWTVSRPLTVIHNDGTVERPVLEGGSSWCAAFTQELQTAVNAIQGAGPLAH